MSQTKLVSRDVTVEYRNSRTGKSVLALDRISLDINEGEFVCIVGPSGCGKTTFLHAVDGLIPLDGGSLWLDGKEIKKPGPDRAMVFQNACLLPWRTVLGNVAYGLDLRGVPKREARERARYFVQLVGLNGFEDSYPSELSGGMQQRCNLARALATDPEILLLDEPFAALDPQTREFMQAELLKIWSKAKKTALFITHQINEAIYLADRVFVFASRPGRVRDVVEVDLARPRPLRLKRDPRFLALEDRIWAEIQEEVMKAGQFHFDEEDGLDETTPKRMTPVA
jgi:NitT/TauT family transport system ATP-binding protein